MGYVEVGLPSLLLILAFALKLFVERTTTAPVFVQALLELPVDIIFLAMSFVTAFILGATGKAAEGLFTFICYVVAAILLVALSRKSITFFESDDLWKVGGLSFVNYGIALSCVVYSISLLKEITA
ncbi:hypothetical protein V4V60_003921 [Vibrio mimicus]|uniref:hypothetical protein n=1 Tax=Vibrio TaxID=662 RepID=UPI00053C9113|nr:MULTISPECIES: hypothetical protein [Vibrio]MCD2151923.1 hypothetical protein [Vibrio parahaemolyticus]HCE3105450.1 hypothetical protein [Vibrio parahaemolyticus]HCJ4668882.1 hypothetical protein [Vibrio parahaemolyticus]